LLLANIWVIAIFAQMGDAEAGDCASSQRFPHASPHLASQGKQYESDLTSAQQAQTAACFSLEASQPT
jgi:hypothetical protein